jgi:hypothetical protein
MSQRFRTALLLLSILSFGCGRSGEPDTMQENTAFQLYLLIGQSNMAGRGVVAEEDRTPRDRVMMLSRDSAWVPAVDPMHFDKPIAGVGPGRAFGIAIAESDPSVRVGLIPAAVGGSPISTWEPGAYYEATDSHPYDDAMERAKRAIRDGTLKAILWHQGESDSHEGPAAEYHDNLVALIGRLRTALDAPDVPFLIGQLGQFDEAPWDEWKEMVDAAQRTVAEELPNVYYVSSDGLQDKGDALHFSADAARELGRRYAETYLSAVRPSH